MNMNKITKKTNIRMSKNLHSYIGQILQNYIDIIIQYEYNEYNK